MTLGRAGGRKTYHSSFESSQRAEYFKPITKFVRVHEMSVRRNLPLIIYSAVLLAEQEHCLETLSFLVFGGKVSGGSSVVHIPVS